jgi:uncharacterized protein (DUF983 family)
MSQKYCRCPECGKGSLTDRTNRKAADPAEKAVICDYCFTEGTVPIEVLKKNHKETP